MIKEYFNIDISDYDLIIEKFKRIELFKFKNCTIFITGGTGFIGKWLVGTLLNLDNIFKLNLKLVILSRRPRREIFKENKVYSDSRIKLIQGDLNYLNSNIKINAKYLIHLAADTNLESINNYEYITKTMLIGNLKILKLIKNNNIPNILMASSGAVYGETKMHNKGYSESQSDSGLFYGYNNFYGFAKKISENFYLNTLSKKKFNLKILRIFTLVGPHLPIDSHYAVANFTKQALNNKNIILNEGQANLRSFLYSADLIVWMLKILLMKKSNSKIFNIGSNYKMSIYHLAKKVVNISKSNSKIIIKKKQNKNIRKKYFPNISLALKNNLNIYTHIDVSIKKYIDFLKKNKINIKKK